MLIVDGKLVYELDEVCADQKKMDLSQYTPYQSQQKPLQLPKQEDWWRYTGKGVCAAVLDTGAYPHPDFQERILAFADMVNGRVQTYDDNGHGTHVTGILAGDGTLSNGRYCGIAPEVGLVVVKVLDEKGKGKLSHMEHGIQWVLRHQYQYGIRVVNISAGTLFVDDAENRRLLDGILQLWNAGLAVCIAAGNEGSKAVTTPGISRAAITVGTMDDKKRKDAKGKSCFQYSGRGPTQFCVCKPEVVAPGTNIISTNSMQKRGGQPYCVKSGTSMSVPFVSGAIACLLQKNPNLTNTEIKLLLRETAEDLGQPKNHQGWGALRLERLLSAVQADGSR